MTGVILFVMLLVVLSYREVVTVYTRAGGSYVVARENFGPRIAQVAAVALLIDYVVTVAVQVAAGTAAVASAFPRSGLYITEISIGVVLVMCYGNLRGIREAGKVFALPTYLFTGSVLLMIAVGLIREVLGNLHPQDVHNLHGTYTVGSGTAGLTSIVLIFTLLRVVRQRRRLADRYRGGVQRGERVPAARGNQRPPGARRRGPHPRHPGRRDLLAGARDPRHSRT